MSPPNEHVSSNFEVNGDANFGAYASNQTIDTTAADVPVDSGAVKESSIEPSSSAEILDSILTNAVPDNSPSDSLEVAVSASAESLPTPSTSVNDSIINNSVEAAVEDNVPTTTVLPIVEAPESDIRDTALPLSPLPDVIPDSQISGEAISSVDLVAKTEVLTKPDSPEEKPIIESQPAASETILNTDATPEIQKTLPETNNLEDTTMKSDLNTTPSVTQSQDIDMADAPSTTIEIIPTTNKVAREREDDNEEEPLAKRAKTDDEPKAPADIDTSAALLNGEQETAKPTNAALTVYQGKELGKILRNSIRTKDGKNFRSPVKDLWPMIAEQYALKVTNPIDLATMEQRVKDGKYATMDDFKADLKLLHDNAVLFNGPDHEVAKSAKIVGDAILVKIASIPPEPVVVPKAAKSKARRSTPATETPTRAPAARRPSRTVATGAVPPQPQTFALDPSTSTPLIRRDSKQEPGGRPKREIHPPKNKDLVYSVRPKSKKFATELKFCEEVITELKKAKYYNIMSAFLTPVDPVALNIPNYFTIIKTPMDISTVVKKLGAGDYTRAKDFEHDMKQIVQNCYKYNPAGNPVREMGHQFEQLFDQQWAKKEKYLADHTPAAFSPSESADEDDTDEEEEPEAAQPTPVSTAATLRLIEEQNKLITLMTNKNSDPAIISMQQDMVDFLTKKVEEETVRAPPAKKASKKSKAVKAPKKAAPVKKATGGNKKSRNPEKYLGTLEKEIISSGLGELPDNVSGDVLQWIKSEQPNLDVSF